MKKKIFLAGFLIICNTIFWLWIVGFFESYMLRNTVELVAGIMCTIGTIEILVKTEVVDFLIKKWRLL
jgi:hypothetical protein